MKTDQKTPPSRGVGIRNISDYSPFGVLLKERTVESADFRLGFQGQEHDDEVKGDGNSVNFKYRMHDPRVGRFFAVDPLTKKYPFYSPYSFSGNKVIHAIELEGAEELVVSTASSASAVPALYVYNESQLQNQVMFILPGTALGTVNTITRPITNTERRQYFGLLNRQPPPGTPSSPATTSGRGVFQDNQGQFINQNLSLQNTGTNLNPVMSPANLTQTMVQGDFGANTTGNMTFNVPLAGGAATMQINYSSAGNMLGATAPWANSFDVIDVATGRVLTTYSPTTSTGSGTATFSIPAGVANIQINVVGTANQGLDAFYFDVTSSGPNASATNIPAVNNTTTVNVPTGSSGAINQSIVTQTTTPVTVNTGVTSSPKAPIND